MPDKYPLTLRQADQARTDFAAVESDLEFIMAQLARIPTRKEQARNTLGIIFATATLSTLAVCGSPAIGVTACDEGRPDHRRGCRCSHLEPALGERVPIP